MKKFVVSAALVFLAMNALPAMAANSAPKDIYNDNCAVCHGNKGEGYDKKVVPNGAVVIKKLAGDAAYWDFAVFKKTVVEGIDDKNRPMRVMPVFGKSGLYEPQGQMLTDDDLMGIQTYMQTFGPKEE